MGKLLALGFDLPVSPRFSLIGVARDPGPGEVDAYGWGVSWYPPNDRAAVVIKDPTATASNPVAALLTDWARFRSTLFVCHLRGAAARRAQEDTQPFVRSNGGHSWLISQTGDLDHDFARRLPLEDNPLLQPIGHTDTEHVFCHLLGRAAQGKVRVLSDFGWDNLANWCREVNGAGRMNLVLSDGLDLVVYQDVAGWQPMHWARWGPQTGRHALESQEIRVELGVERDDLRTGTLFSTEPLSGGSWSVLEPGQLIVVRRGAIVFSTHGELEELNRRLLTPGGDTQQLDTATATGTGSSPASNTESNTGSNTASSAEASMIQAARRRTSSEPLAQPHGEPPSALLQHGQPLFGEASRILTVEHTTRYSYEKPVDRSRHVLRLQPVIDPQQSVLDFSLEIEPHGRMRPYQDVFGNWAVVLDQSERYSELVVSSRSRVLIPLEVLQPATNKRTTIPVPWMPWDREMMMPYLLPPELPEAQLAELFEYAMSFVERRAYDLVETLDDINKTIYREYQYTPGHTNVETTPFEVYSSRKGVCQDFANLMICLARLLGVPSRYRTGYIYTGARYDNKLQSDASHAWAELYLPRVGWLGFDPTNGCRAGQDHVRVACGRNYRDATPTSGTIFGVAGTETLVIDVKVLAEPAEQSA